MKKHSSFLFTSAAVIALLAVFVIGASAKEPMTFNASEHVQKYVVEKETYKMNSGYSMASEYNSFGEVISVIDSYSDGSVSRQSFSYDKNGNRTYESCDDAEDDTWSVSYTYNSDNNIIKMVRSGSSVTSTTTYAYDEDQNLVKEETKHSDGDWSRIIYTFDGEGLLLTTKESDSDGYSNTRVFDENGNITKQTEKDPDGSLTVRSFSFDSDGRLTKETHKFPDGESETTSYKYNDSGLLIKEIYSDSDGSSETTVNSYDGEGRLIKTVFKSAEGYSEKTEFKYDDKGNKIKESYSDSEGKTYTYVFDYDNSGNRVEEKYSSSFNGSSKRVLTYDEKGNLTKEYYRGSEGYSSTETYSFDANGNMVEYIYKNSDGQRSTQSFTYKKLSSPMAVIKTPVEDVLDVTLEKASFDYDGKAKKPVVLIHDSYGQLLCRGADYKLTYSNNVKAGKASVRIDFTGSFINKPPMIVYYNIKPAKVSALKAEKASKTAIILSWAKAAGAKYYKVEVSTDGKNWKAAATVSTNEAKIKGLKAGTKYRFRVKALDGKKKVSGAFSEILKTGTLTAAPEISKLTSTKSKTATVTWEKVKGAKSYTVYTSADGKTFKEAKTGVTKTSCSITGLKTGKKVYVKLVAVNAYGKKSAASEVKSVKVK